MCSAVPTTQKASQSYYCGFQHFLPYHLLLHKSSWIAWPSNLYQSFPFLQRTVTAATLTVLCILIRSSWTNRKRLFRTKHDVDCDSEASSPDHRGLLSRSRPNPKDWWHKTLQNSHLCWQANGIHRLILWTAQLKHNKRSRYACCEGKANSLFAFINILESHVKSHRASQWLTFDLKKHDQLMFCSDQIEAHDGTLSQIVLLCHFSALLSIALILLLLFTVRTGNRDSISAPDCHSVSLLSQRKDITGSN